MQNAQPTLFNWSRIPQYALGTLLLLFCGSRVHAQTPQSQASAANQISILQARVATLEQKLAKLQKQLLDDEASSTNSPADPVGAPTDGPKAPAETGKSNDKQLAELAKKVDQLLDAQKEDAKNGETHTVNHPGAPTRVTAPFQVVDGGGKVILSVEANQSGVTGGIKMSAPDGTSLQIGAGTRGHAGIRFYDGTGGSDPTPAAFVGFAAGAPRIALQNQSGNSIAQLISQNGHGELDLMNTTGQTVALIGSNPTNGEGRATFTDPGGIPLAKIGAAGTHGDVLLGGPNKGVAVWEMTLTGFH